MWPDPSYPAVLGEVEDRRVFDRARPNGGPPNEGEGDGVSAPRGEGRGLRHAMAARPGVPHGEGLFAVCAFSFLSFVDKLSWSMPPR